MELNNVVDSYAERRQLFKNIWETAMKIDEKDTDIINKPKVIKTLKLDEVDRCAISKKKKMKLKNLRTVCNKLLEFCDKQEADDFNYEKVKAERQFRNQHHIYLKQKKVKKIPTKKRVKMSKSLSSPAEEPAQAKTTSSENKEAKSTLPEKKPDNPTPSEPNDDTSGNGCSREFSPSKEKINISTNKPSRSRRNSSVLSKQSSYRKTVKKNTKKKRISNAQMIPSSGPTKHYNNVSAVVAINTTKELPLHKINIA